MFTKLDFERRAASVISDYPLAAALYQAGDPRLLAQLGAMAAMLAMLSQQVEVAALEAFIKSRDATVLADAALKGILPFARAAKGRIAASNPLSTPYVISPGRVILDSAGRPWVVTKAATIPAATLSGPGTGTVDAEQVSMRVFTHTVTTSRPFYTIEIEQPPADQFLVEVSVERSTDSVTFNYRPSFVNVAPGDLVFHVETDEYRRSYIKFGYAIA